MKSFGANCEGLLSRSKRYQQVNNPYPADDHSQHLKIEYLLFKKLSLYYFDILIYEISIQNLYEINSKNSDRRHKTLNQC